ncbi:hypothetical protein DUI87_32714 [Hirundo rustica rustica]|uniref:NAD(P)(+)--arginine ADP-ribosyltransferase n=1 Tax=Hirundo rustica rustica TaxID=333673 RepID=A0A3M0INE6_HIRRU|nr:hypothetical protein DUI87_32714 [Hirundo rustica rustica]
MAPLAHTLALLAMAMATADIKELPLDMAPNSFDDQYLKCRDTMPENFLDLQLSDFCENKMFAKNWTKAKADWAAGGSISHSLTPDQAIAVRAYTMKELPLYQQFNAAVRVAGSNKWMYWNLFHFKSLHFLLTQALQKLRRPNQCYDVHRGVGDIKFKANKNRQSPLWSVYVIVNERKGGSLPRNSPHLGVLLLATVAMAVDLQRNEDTKATKTSVTTMVTVATVTIVAIVATVATLAPRTTLGIGSTMATMAIVATVTHEATVATVVTMVTETTEATVATVVPK